MHDTLPPRFTLRSCLGDGATAATLLCHDDKLNQLCAIKALKSRSNARHRAHFETEVHWRLKKLSHPHIVQFIDRLEVRGRSLLVQEACVGGELFADICERERISERETARAIFKLTSAVSYMHARGVVHRDLKPENLVLRTARDATSVVIIDFGLAVDTTLLGGERLLRGAAGTLAYMAPEVARREAYDCRCDVWSLGICTYVMLAGHPVYSPDDHDELLRKVRSGAIRYYPATWDRVEPRARAFCESVLVPQADRPHAAALLGHEWFREAADDDATLPDAARARLRNFVKSTAAPRGCARARGIGGRRARRRERRRRSSPMTIRRATLAAGFDALDRDGDGVLSADEVGSASLFLALDGDGDGVVNFDEFCAGAANALAPDLDGSLTPLCANAAAGSLAHALMPPKEAAAPRCARCRKARHPSARARSLSSASPRRAATSKGTSRRRRRSAVGARAPGDAISVARLAVFLGGDTARAERALEGADLDGDGVVDWDDFRQSVFELPPENSAAPRPTWQSRWRRSLTLGARAPRPSGRARRALSSSALRLALCAVEDLKAEPQSGVRAIKGLPMSQ